MDPRTVIEEFNVAWVAHDLDGALGFLAEDCVFEATGPAPGGVRHVGVAAIRGVWAPIFADQSSRFETEETIVAGDRVIQRWRYHWDGGYVRGIDVYTVTNERISEKLSYVKG